MAVDKHPSRRPSPPRRPPPTSTTDGQPNTVGKTMTGDGMMQYGSRNGRNMRLEVKSSESEFAHHFQDSRGSASRPGKAQPQEGTASRASRPGDQKSNDEPG